MSELLNAAEKLGDHLINRNNDLVNHPKHYLQYPCEVIEITEKLSFLRGNVIKYVLRAEFKGAELEDLKKAQWYLNREIKRLENEA